MTNNFAKTLVIAVVIFGLTFYLGTATFEQAMALSETAMSIIMVIAGLMFFLLCMSMVASSRRDDERDATTRMAKRLVISGVVVAVLGLGAGGAVKWAIMGMWEGHHQSSSN